MYMPSIPNLEKHPKSKILWSQVFYTRDTQPVRGMKNFMPIKIHFIRGCTIAKSGGTQL
jgi:hypothetical protein